MKKLPVGKSDFKDIIENNFVYIDKTKYIYDLVNGSGQYFLSRPRRFGKSMLVSTLENIFKGRKEFFKDLYIYDKIEWKVYPIIKISFLNISYKTPEMLEESLTIFLSKVAKDYDIVLENSNYKEAFTELIEKLSKIEQVIILIDEYDKPLIDYIENTAQASKNREILKTFYSTIKGCEEYLKFVFITGVSKFSQTSLFSDLNNLNDITIDDNYNGICGYKKKDIENNFQDYIEELAIEYNKSLNEIFEDIKIWYNGYSWDGNEFLYNPFSVLNLFSKKTFSNYWFKSGSPTFLLKLIKTKKYNLTKVEKIEVADDTFDKYNIENISIIALLFQTGYLTIKKRVKSTQGTIYTLDYPNFEVKKSLLEHLISEYSGESNGAKSIFINQLRQNLINKEFDEFIEILKSLFAGLVYETQVNKEDFYSSIMYMILSLCGIYGDFEPMTNKGRLDCVIELKKIIYIIEFKVNASADIALRQIYEKKYYEKYLNRNKEIYLVGLAFNKEEKNISDYKFLKYQD
jgi:hypothetical protein